MSCLKYDNVTVLYRSYIANLSPLTLNFPPLESIWEAYHSIIQINRMSSLFLTVYIYCRMRHSLNNSNKHGNFHQNSETSCVFISKAVAYWNGLPQLSLTHSYMIP